MFNSSSDGRYKSFLWEPSKNFSISLKNQNFLENDDEIKEFKQIKNSLEKDFKNS